MPLLQRGGASDGASSSSALSPPAGTTAASSESARQAPRQSSDAAPATSDAVASDPVVDDHVDVGMLERALECREQFLK